MGNIKYAYDILVGRSEGKLPLGKPRNRWDDNLNMYLEEIRVGIWIGLIWLRIRTGGGLL
jgi:hypothetical protein